MKSIFHTTSLATHLTPVEPEAAYVAEIRPSTTKEMRILFNVLADFELQRLKEAVDLDRLLDLVSNKILRTRSVTLNSSSSDFLKFFGIIVSVGDVPATRTILFAKCQEFAMSGILSDNGSDEPLSPSDADPFARISPSDGVEIGRS